MNDMAKPDKSRARNIVTQKGDATGRIVGMSHIQLVCNDMDEAVKFYRDVLGFKIVRTIGEEDGLHYAQKLGIKDTPIVKNYFFDMGNGNLLSIIQVRKASKPETSVYIQGLWPGGGTPPEVPRKMDHLAFNVPTLDDLLWFRDRLVAAGVKVSGVTRHDDHHEVAPTKFVKSIYFYDPSGIALEIATFDWDNPQWADHKPENWLNDPDPVPSVLPGK